MSYNDKNDKNINNPFTEPMADDFNIKSHLNSSLELQGITITEELIAKTLEKISQDKSQPKGDQTGAARNDKTEQANQDSKIKWFQYRYPRIVAGAAAAVIVLAVGLSYVSGLGKNDFKDMSTAPKSDINMAADTANSGSADSQAKESANGANDHEEAVLITPQAQVYASVEDVDNSDAAAAVQNGATDAVDNADNTSDSASVQADTTESGDIPSATEDSNADEVSDAALTFAFADKSISDGSEGIDARLTSDPSVTDVPEDSDTGGSADMVQGITSILNDDNSDELTFQNIVPVANTDIGKINITDTVNNMVVTLDTPEKIQEFYDLMEQQKFTTGSQASDSISYTIEVTGLQTQDILYTMTIGDTVAINTTTEDVVSESYYLAVDLETLKKSLADLMNN